MFLFRFIIIFCLFFIVSSLQPVFAETSIYRSAGWVATDGSMPYTNTANCQATDGIYCSRPLASAFGNLYFSSFGTLSDFGIPAGSFITKLRIKITGKNTVGQYIGVNSAQNYMPFLGQCQVPSDVWTAYLGDVDTLKEFQTYTGSNSLTGCVTAGNINMQRLTFRVNHSSTPAWSADIDNFEIAFDYVLPFTAGPAWINEGNGMSFSDYRSVLLPNGKVLVAGGQYVASPTNIVHAYTHGQNGTGDWDHMARMQKERQRHTLNLLANGKVFVAGGHPTASGNTAELYDPQANTWTNTANLHTGRGDHASSALPNGDILVTGGYLSSVTNTTEAYDLDTNAWTVKDPLNVARGGHEQVNFTDAQGNSKVMVIGGSNLSQALSSTEIYDIATNSWSMGPSLQSARYDFSAVKLHDGRILVIGGDAGNNSEVYNPITNGWTTYTPSYEFRRGAVVVLGEEENYKVLAAGGMSATTNAMIFDPTTNVWTNTIEMLTPRFDFNLTLLQNGTVLAAGGQTSYAHTGTSEVYVPTEDRGQSERQVIFIHGINTSATAAQACLDNGFQKILCDGSLHGNVHLFTYYQDLAYQLEGDNCDVQPPPNTSTGSLHTHPGSISPDICDSQSAIAYNATKLSDFISSLDSLDSPVTIINYSMGAPITRGWLTLAQSTVGDTTLDIVDTIISFQGVQKGSYIAYGSEVVNVLTVLSPSPIAKAIFAVIPSVARELTGLDFNRPAREDLTPLSDWYISANQILPTDLHYFNFYSDININLRPKVFFVDLDPIATFTTGDLVILPGTPETTSLDLLGGARFLPGGVETTDRHEYRLHSAHDVFAGLAIRAPIESIANVINDPRTHMNLYNHLDDDEVKIASCESARGDVIIKEEVLRILEDPENACDN